ncbi:metallophosphoesterase [Mahella sp.]|uniref:metallophosphoesterase n=1 Tax=Mahella sp. TaxID=2798721 RepID=UPI0025BC9D1A|nr:metallophosphoesterase [Mahella sp.]MBZ4665974.1 metallophosphoesterase [Mahella sp.]
MALYAMADIHLALSVNKPMDIFGKQWENYMDRIADNWMATITDNDCIIIAGDISWAIHIEELDKDFEFLNQLPGQKVFVKGNHDYWWNSMSKLKEYVEAHGFRNMIFLHNNAYRYKDIVICGSRGWMLPGDPGFTAEDEKVYRRELMRLRLSLEQGVKLKGGEILVAMHYPPATIINPRSEFMDIMNEYGVRRCVYGHLHDSGKRIAINGRHEGIDMYLTASEYLQFIPLKLED